MNIFFFVLSLSFVLVGAGCTPKNLVPTTSVSFATETSKLSEPNVEKIPAGWFVYTHPTLGFSIAYPGKQETNLLKETVSLPDPTGNKQPNMIIHVGEKDASLDKEGCLEFDWLPTLQKIKLAVHGITFCESVMEEGAAGSIYRTQYYTTVLSGEIVTIEFVLRYPTSVREYAGCEDATESKPKCKELAFDNARDTAMFSEIMATFKSKK